MKIAGNGQAKILSPHELDQLFEIGLQTDRDRALFGVMRFCGCRVSEAVQLDVEDVQGGIITLRKRNTKGAIATRSIPIHPQLRELLDNYTAPAQGYLFPGRDGVGHLHRAQVDRILRQACDRAACDRLHLKGVSTHSFRRSALTQMHNEGVPLRVIQRISGHSSLATLQKYLEVNDGQIEDAIAVL